MKDFVLPNLDFPGAAHAVIALGARAAQHGWVVATGGNFSVRMDEKRYAITATGTDKGALTFQDVLEADMSAPPPPRSSAEAPLHHTLYKHGQNLGAVVHVHSPAAILISLLTANETISLTGYELLKALAGITTHETSVNIPLFDNSQNMDILSPLAEQALRQSFVAETSAPAFLLRGHGLTAWGRNAHEAFRHAEALEFLFGLELEKRRLMP